MDSELWQEIDALWRKLFVLQQQFDDLGQAPRPALRQPDKPYSSSLLERIERLEELFAQQLGQRQAASRATMSRLEPTLEPVLEKVNS